MKITFFLDITVNKSPKDVYFYDFSFMKVLVLTLDT